MNQKQIVEFRLESGDSILVEVARPMDNRMDSRVGLREDIVEKAQKTFESALNTIKPVATTIMSKVQSLNHPADEVEVKFGLKMTAELEAVIASGNGEVNYEITMKWKQLSKNSGTP